LTASSALSDDVLLQSPFRGRGTNANKTLARGPEPHLSGAHNETSHADAQSGGRQPFFLSRADDAPDQTRAHSVTL
jgi:hypothetical protein